MKPAANKRSGGRIGSGRSLLLTLGAFLLGLMAVVWCVQGKDSDHWRFRAWVVFGGGILLGLLSLGVGFLATGTTREERLRVMPATGLNVLFGLVALAVLFGFIRGVHSLFPSLDKGELKTAMELAVAVTFGLLVFGGRLFLTAQSKRIQKRMDKAMRNALDGTAANKQRDGGPR
jgi:MFS family permease